MHRSITHVHFINLGRQKQGLLDLRVLAVARYTVAKNCLNAGDPALTYCAQWLGDVHYGIGTELFRRRAYAKSVADFKKARAYQVCRCRLAFAHLML